jgi:PAS domain S-box-containing protein
MSRDDALRAGAGVQRATLVAGFAAALVAALLAGLLSRSLTRPLAAMAESVKRFTGEQEVTLPANATAEVDTLARAFARMTGSIREKTAALHQEIAERTRAEERERIYVAAVESANDAIVTSTMDGFFTTWNAGAERMFGYSAKEALGQSIGLIAPSERREEQLLHRIRLWRGEGIQDVESMRRAKDGSLRDVSVTLSPIRGPDGALIGVSAIYRDISERKQQEKLLQARAEELQRSNAELEQFAYVASHDLQEPLRMVASYAELLAERYQGKLDARADKYIGYAVDGAKRMQRLVNDLLSFSRAGRNQTAAQPTDLNVVVKDVLRTLNRAIENACAKIETGTLPTVAADGGQLAQVFQNLIGNAVKFHGESQPTVQIRAERRADGWTISVKDNGIGIEEQYSERIFQMFQRLHDRESYEGNGIGLPIAKKIVERHGGRIWFESVPNQGTTFFFTLPQNQEKAA